MGKDINHLLLFAHYKDEHSSVFQENLPVDMLREIFSFKEALDQSFKPALGYAATGNFEELKALLEKQPLLVIFRGDVTTSKGIALKNTTLLECALHTGDFKLAQMIASYFDILKEGTKEKEKQLTNSRETIEALTGSQKIQDMDWLFDVIKESSFDDVQEELATGTNYKTNYDSGLRDALNALKEEVKEAKDKGDMYCNYEDLVSLYEKLKLEYNNLVKINQGKSDSSKVDLILEKVIGLVQQFKLSEEEIQSLPGDRQKLVMNGAQFIKDLRQQKISNLNKLASADANVEFNKRPSK